MLWAASSSACLTFRLPIRSKIEDGRALWPPSSGRPQLAALHGCVALFFLQTHRTLQVVASHLCAKRGAVSLRGSDIERARNTGDD